MSVISLLKGVLLRSQKFGNLTQPFRTPEKQSAKNQSVMTIAFVP
jgi:hypothetical protein